MAHAAVLSRRMQELGYPERHHLNAAVGWLKLGDLAEAKAEADQVSWLNRFHPEVFIVRWCIHSRVGKWEAARDLARIFTRLFPDRPTGWLCLSYSLYKLNRPLEAYLQLLHRIAAFPRVCAIPYFLACYAWKLGDFRGAGRWIAKFKSLGGGRKIKSGVLDHTELLLSCEKASSLPVASPKSSSRRDPIALA
ncbi:MAG: hypothetical protein DME18_10915 [Verrucomicrobia bacterium]|nr:MAG: hypothetical protein DME18_10915 [Verrucomicrobiota bacterium]